MYKEIFGNVLLNLNFSTLHSKDARMPEKKRIVKTKNIFVFYNLLAW